MVQKIVKNWQNTITNADFQDLLHFLKKNQRNYSILRDSVEEFSKNSTDQIFTEIFKILKKS